MEEITGASATNFVEKERELQRQRKQISKKKKKKETNVSSEMHSLILYNNKTTLNIPLQRQRKINTFPVPASFFVCRTQETHNAEFQESMLFLY